MTGASCDSYRQKSLEYVNCRPFLIAVCAIVIVECACVIAELMIDLHGIKSRYESEETEINRFVSHLRGRYPDVFIAQDIRTVSDVISFLDQSMTLISSSDKLSSPINCTCVDVRDDTEAVEAFSMKSAHFKTRKFPSAVPLFADEAVHSNLYSLQDEQKLFGEAEVLKAKLTNSTDELKHLMLHMPSLALYLLSASFMSNTPFPVQWLLPFPTKSLIMDPSSLSPKELHIYSDLSYPYTTKFSPSFVFRRQYKNPDFLRNHSTRHMPDELFTVKSNDIDSKCENVSFVKKKPIKGTTGMVYKISPIFQPFIDSVMSRSYMFNNNSIEEIFRRDNMNHLLTQHLLADASMPSSITKEAGTDNQTNSESETKSWRRDFPLKSTQSKKQSIEVTMSPSSYKIKTLREKQSKNSGFTRPSLSSRILYSSKKATHNGGSFFKRNITRLYQFELESHSLPSAESNQVKSYLLTTNKTIFQTNITAYTSNQSSTDYVMPLDFKSDKEILSEVAKNISLRNSRITLHDIFILEINNVGDNFFLFAKFKPDRHRTKFTPNKQGCCPIFKASKAVHLLSVSFLSLMLLEIAVKLACSGCAFFRKKFEVFDALIVVLSFTLGCVLLDGRWYGTGKSSTTILLLLLPWRVVRIVNSFLMTVKYKHHLQMMNLKRAKKKAELQYAKLQTLSSEIRKDVKLLVALCRYKEVEEKDIAACLCSRDRRSIALSAMSACTSLVLISTMGKDTLEEDDIYGKMFKEALSEDNVTEMDAEIIQAEETEIDAVIELDERVEASSQCRKYKSKRRHIERSYTVPVRVVSLEIPETDLHESSSNILDGIFNKKLYL